MFEEAARGHAAELVRRGRLPADLIVGRWWATRGEQCEVDVLGLRGQHTALIGEARWQEQPLGASDVSALRSKLRHVPNPNDSPLVVLWGRSGITREAQRAGALGWSLADMLKRTKGRP